MSYTVPKWMDEAICRQTGPTMGDLWYPEKGQNVRATAQQAKERCEVCPVKQRCLDHALAYDEQWGIWGGTNFSQTRFRHRQQMRRERGIRLIERHPQINLTARAIGGDK